MTFVSTDPANSVTVGPDDFCPLPDYADAMPTSRGTDSRSQERRAWKPCFLNAWLAHVGRRQIHFAEATGYTRGHVSAVANGTRPWTQEFLEIAVDYFRKNGEPDISPGDLIDIDPSDPAQGELYMRARRVPADRRDVAADLLRGLSERREDIFTHRPPAPRKKRSR